MKTKEEYTFEIFKLNKKRDERYQKLNDQEITKEIKGDKQPNNSTQILHRKLISRNTSC